ncbi:hypothetical protein BG842_26690 [Haladaptatus sp. W1]|nr:hypothetical protein BG842_26690 [Haladaptatus sp. W1]
MELYPTDVLHVDALDAFDVRERLLDGFRTTGIVGDDDRWQERDETERNVVAFEAVDFRTLGSESSSFSWRSSRSISGLCGITLTLAATFPMVYGPRNPQSGHS